jgi:hypothetical protein
MRKIMKGKVRNWYCVTSTIDDNGKFTAIITGVCAAESRPAEEKFAATKRKDIYVTWFWSERRARDYIAAMLNDDEEAA